jgi:nucleoside-diphosphate-sugar epimerase
VEQKDKIIITGANGFVGSALVKMLSSRGFSVLPLVRKADTHGAKGCKVIGDYRDFNEWGSLMPGVDVIVHLAAKVHQPRDAIDKSYFAINVDVSKNIALAARQSGVRRFVYISTVKVNGELTSTGEKFSGIDKPSPQGAYGRSKCQAEKALQEIFHGSDTELVIIRPPLVYGPSVSANFKKLTWLARLPFPLPFAAVRNKRDMVSVLNLCELIVLCCSHPDAPARVWMAADAEPYSLAGLIAEIRAVNARPPGLFAVPVTLLKWVLILFRMSALSDRLFSDLQVDIEPTKKILGWSPVHSFSQTMEPANNSEGTYE